MRKRILAVDDSISMREMVSFTLSEAGFDVVTAVDGLDGVKKLDGTAFDMVITDLNMPNLDGIEFIKKLRQISAYKFIPVIMLTTESETSKKMAGRAAGANGWIVKPFKPEQLLSVVNKVIG